MFKDKIRYQKPRQATLHPARCSSIIMDTHRRTASKYDYSSLRQSKIETDSSNLDTSHTFDFNRIPAYEKQSLRIDGESSKLEIPSK